MSTDLYTAIAVLTAVALLGALWAPAPAPEPVGMRLYAAPARRRARRNGRKANQARARRARKSRQARNRRNKAARTSIGAKVARRTKTAAKVERRVERRIQAAEAAIAVVNSRVDATLALAAEAAAAAGVAAAAVAAERAAIAAEREALAAERSAAAARRAARRARLERDKDGRWVVIELGAQQAQRPVTRREVLARPARRVRLERVNGSWSAVSLGAKAPLRRSAEGALRRATARPVAVAPVRNWQDYLGQAEARVSTVADNYAAEVAAAIGAEPTRDVVMMLDASSVLAAIAALDTMSMPQVKAAAIAAGLSPAGDRRRKTTWLEAVREHYALKLQERKAAAAAAKAERIAQIAAAQVAAEAEELGALSNEALEAFVPAENRTFSLEEELEFLPAEVNQVGNPFANQDLKAILAEGFGAFGSAILKQGVYRTGYGATCQGHVMYWPLVGVSALIRRKAPLNVAEFARVAGELKAAGAKEYAILDTHENYYPSLALISAKRKVNFSRKEVSAECGRILERNKTLGLAFATKQERNAYMGPLVRAMATYNVAKVPVLVPSELLAAAPKFLKLQGKLIGIDSAAVMPAHGFEYEEAKEIFAYLESKMQSDLRVYSLDENGKPKFKRTSFPKAIDSRPISFVDRGEEFDLYLGVHARITVRSCGEVVLYRLDRRMRLTFQQVFWVAPRMYGEQPADKAVLLSAIDQLLYIFETYMSVEMNREYGLTKNSQVDPLAAQKQCSDYVHYALLSYIADHAKTEMGVALYENSQRKMFTSATATVVEGAINLPFRRGHNAEAILDFVGFNREKATKQMKGVIARTSLVTRPQGYNVGRRSIAAANAWGLVQLPYGSMNLSGQRFLMWESAGVTVEARRQDIMNVFAGNSVKWFGRQLDVVADYDTIVAEIDKIAKAQMESVFASIEVDSDAWWLEVTNRFMVNWSTKEAKSMKRNASNFAQVCQVDNEERMAFIFKGEACVPTARVVKTALALQAPVAPGIGYVRPGTFMARYEVSGKRRRLFMPDKENALVLAPEFASLAEVDTTTRGIMGYRFNEAVAVSVGQVVATFTSAGGVQTAITAEYDAMLDRVSYQVVGEMGTQKCYVTLHYIKATPTVKLRYGVKLNAVEANLDSLLSCNGADKAAVDMLVPLDCNKWMDSADFPYPIIAETFKRTPWGRRLLEKANALAGVKADDVLVFDKTLRVTGKYDFLYDEFVARFGRRIWVTQTAVAGEYARIMSAMHTAQSGWRSLTAEEITEFGFDKVAGNGAVFITNAAGAIDSVKDCVYAAWHDAKSGQDVVLIGGFGFMGTVDEPLYYPVTVEYTTVEQAVTDTSMMPFSLMDIASQGVEGLRYALELVSSSAYRRDLDIFFSHMLEGNDVRLKGGQVLPVVNVEDVFTKEFRARLRAAVRVTEVVDGIEVSRLRTPSEWLGYLVDQPEVAGRSVAIEVNEVDENGNYVKVRRNLYLPMIAYLAGRSIDTTDATVADRVYSYVYALAHEHAYNGSEMLDLAGDIVRMMTSFREGKSHKKSILRAANSVYAKAAALPVIPTSVVYVRKGGKLARKIRSRFGRQVQYLGFRRMPMTRTAVFELRFVEEDGWLGAYKLSGDRFYFGTFGQYFNWGDLDGDSDEFSDVTEAVKRGLLTPDNLDTLMELAEEALGTNMLGRDFWARVEAGDVPAQYWADHLNIPTYGALMNKIGLSLKKSVTFRDTYVDFQKAAYDVQTIAVGTTYRASTIAMMLAEVLPIVFKYENMAYNGVPTALETEFAFLKDAKAARGFKSRLQQVYEVALGGYDKYVAKVILGYFGRLLRWEDEQDWDTLAILRGNVHSQHAGFDAFPELGPVGSVTTVKHKEAIESFKALGFAEADFSRFYSLFRLAGLCKNLGKEWEGGMGLGIVVANNKYLDRINSPFAATALAMVEVLFNVSQNRYAQSDNSLTVELLREYVSSCKDDTLYKEFLAELTSASVTGALFQEFSRTVPLTEGAPLTVSSFESFKDRG